MKILYTNFHGGNGGGHVTYIVNLLRGLVGEHALAVACPAGSRLHRLASEVSGVNVVGMEFTTRPSSWFGPRAKLRSFLKQERFDVIHVNGSADHKQVMLALVGLSPRPSVVFTKHNDHRLSSFGHRLRAWFATDHVIAVSDYIRGLIMDSPYRRCGVTTIRHGVDTDYFAPVSLAEKRVLRRNFFSPDLQDKILLGSAGGTDLEKGWLDLVFALAQLPESTRSRFHIVVAGDPPRDALLAEVDALDMRSSVSFPGLIDDVRPILTACDAGFVLSYQEALSFACREMMSLGLPVIVTRVGGLPENLTSAEQGWIVGVRDSKAMAHVLMEIVADPGMLVQRGLAARDHAERAFNLADFCAQTLVVYQAVCHGTQRGTRPSGP